MPVDQGNERSFNRACARSSRDRTANLAAGMGHTCQQHGRRHARIFGASFLSACSFFSTETRRIRVREMAFESIRCFFLRSF
jgi:hypothetical protein